MSNTQIGECRFSYVNIDEPVDRLNTGNPKYSITLLIPKDDEALVNKIKNDINQALQEGKNKVFNGTLPNNPKTTLHDGDGLKQNGEPFGPECNGHWVMTCTTSAKYSPGVIVRKNGSLMKAEPGEVKSGDYGYATVSFKAYNVNGSKGIGSYLNNVCKTRDGEPLGGARRSAMDEFKFLQDDPDFKEDTIDNDFSGLDEPFDPFK